MTATFLIYLWASVIFLVPTLASKDTDKANANFLCAALVKHDASLFVLWKHAGLSAATIQDGSGSSSQPLRNSSDYTFLSIIVNALIAAGTLVIAGYSIVMGRAARDSATAVVNSERAWVMVEIMPVCKKFGGEWHRPSATGGWVALNQTECLLGYQHRHRLLLKNTGRTSATIITFKLRHMDMTADLSTWNSVDDMDVKEFDHILTGNESTEVTDIKVNKYVEDSIKAVRSSNNFVVFAGSLEYQTVFSEDVEAVHFCYVYDIAAQQLTRIPYGKIDKPKKKKWYDRIKAQIEQMASE